MIPREAEETPHSLIAGGLRKSSGQLVDRIAPDSRLAGYLTGGMRLAVVTC